MDETCVGVLLVHEDGEVLFCTEEEGGRPCRGGRAPWGHRRVVPCAAAFPVSHCAHCTERRAQLHRLHAGAA